MVKRTLTNEEKTRILLEFVMKEKAKDPKAVVNVTAADETDEGGNPVFKDQSRKDEK